MKIVLRKPIKILNLYAGLGGNRKNWTNCKVTAVENSPEIARAYKVYNPEDEVVVCDAHAFLLENFSKYDFIWSSPPCPSHSQYRYNVGVRAKGFNVIYPDLKLYEEILLLMHYFKGGWVVENTRPFYKPLVPHSVVLQRHYIWSNFLINPKNFKAKNIRSNNKISDYKYLGYDLEKFSIQNKRQVLRNCVDKNIGKHIYSEYTRSRN